MLTLNNYDGKGITIGGAGKVDITIELMGANTVTGSIKNTNGGDITITGSGSLEVNSTRWDDIDVYGIAVGDSNGIITGNVTITGNAEVTINATNNYNGYRKAYGIYARKDITISEQASVNITCKMPDSPSGNEACCGMYTDGKVTIDTEGKIKVNVKNVKDYAFSYGVYSSSTPTLTKVGSMEVEWKKANSLGYALYPNGSSFSESTHAVNIDNTNCYASYRYGTPYEVTVTNGYLTGTGVKSESQKTRGNFLENDTVTLTAPNRQASSTDTTNIPFVKWVSKDVTITNPTNQSGASFTMPDKDVAVMAQYNPFTVQPSFTKDSSYQNKGAVSFTLVSSNFDSIYAPKIYRASDLEKITDGYETVSGNQKKITVFSNSCPDGEYVVGVAYNGVMCYSEPFTVNYSATPATKPATAIYLNKSAITLTVGGEETLTATVTPSDSTDTVVWSSSKEDVATVTNGKVKAISAGTAVITAKAGDKSATCTVTVENAPVTHPAKPTIEVTGTYTYNGSEQTANVTGYDSATMNITGNKGKNAGDYIVSVTSKTGQWADGTTEAVTKNWSIAKADDPAYAVPTGLTGTKGNKLSTVTLPQNWEWKAPDTVMSEAGTKTFKAKFTPADTTNYNTVDNVDVTVEVSKDTPVLTSIAVPTATTGLVYTGSEQQGVPGGTGYTLTGHKATNAKEDYKATATLKSGYKWSDGTTDAKEITWSIAKATPSYTVPTGLKGTKGNALSTVTLPSNWAWVDGTTVMSATGNQTFKAKFTPADTENYNTVDNVDVIVAVSATGSGSSSGGGGGGGGVTKYAVAVSPTDNGKVTPDKTSAAKGSVVTITAMANDGYALDTIKATDKAGKEIKLTDKGDGKYTFTMPASKVEVKAAFKQTASKPGKPAEEMKTVVVMQVGSKTMFVNGKAYEKDAAPVIMNDRTLVPIRFVTESLGGTVAWNAETKEVTLVIDGKEIKMTIGKTIEKYGVAPVIIDSRTFVPVRFVADELGATTAWNAETKTVTITKAVTPMKTEK